MKKKVSEIRLFYSGIISKIDWISIALLFLFCFFTMYYADITVTGQYGLTFLDSLFDGKLFSFYSNALSSGIAPEGAVYDIGTYIIFGAWSLPVWICHKVAGISPLIPICLLWFKMLPVIFWGGSVRWLNVITEDLEFEREKRAEISLIYMLSATAFFPVFVVAQYDVIPLYFMLKGIHYFLKGDNKRFLLYFGISMTVKPLTILVLFLLILIKEKNLLKIAWMLFEGSLLMLVCKVCYFTNPAYQKSCSGFMANNLPNLLNAELPGSYSNISVFILFLVCIYIYAYMHDFIMTDVTAKRRMTVLIFAIWASFCAFGTMTPYWTIYMAPFAVITAFIDGRYPNRTLTVDIAGNFALMILLIMKYSWVYGGDLTYAYLILKRFCGKAILGEQGTTVAGILRHLSVQNLLPAMGAMLVAWLVFEIYNAWRCTDNIGITEETRTKALSIWQVRIRVLLGYGWIVLTVGALALTVMGF